MLAAEQNNDDVDTVKYAKKRRIEENYFEGSSYHKSRGRYMYKCVTEILFFSTPPFSNP